MKKLMIMMLLFAAVMPSLCAWDSGNFIIAKKLPMLYHLSSDQNETTKLYINLGNNPQVWGAPSSLMFGYNVVDKLFVMAGAFTDFDDIFHISFGARYYLLDYDEYNLWVDGNFELYFIDDTSDRFGLDGGVGYEFYISKNFSLGADAGIGYIDDITDFMFQAGLSFTVYIKPDLSF